MAKLHMSYAGVAVLWSGVVCGGAVWCSMMWFGAGVCTIVWRCCGI